jgi:hypothetical protein
MTPPTGSIWTEQLALSRLHVRYERDRDLFSRRELARLSFVRWLYQTGRLLP